MKKKKYFISITLDNGREEIHRSSSERYIRNIIKSMYDEVDGMYEKYWNARIICNLPEYEMNNIVN